MLRKKTVIVGSGVSALMLARMIRTYKTPETEIIIVEREAKVGGQFGSVDYGQHGYFDYGMHIYYECGIREIDELFTSLLPESEWNILTHNLKDVAGIYFNGKLQTNTPYPDLRSWPEEKWKTLVGSLFQHIKTFKKDTPVPDANAYQILTQHFGRDVTDEVFVPILQKLYLNHPSNLDEIATKLTAINRVALFDEATMLDLMKADAIRARVCYPNQFTLPAYRTIDQRGFYPKSYGMVKVLDRFKATLENENVTFLTSASITSLAIEHNHINAINFNGANGLSVINDIDKVYWTAGLPPLALALKLDLSGMKNDKREPAFYVNFLFDKMPAMERLYYFYCFDADFRTFRVTNYTNYCPQATDGRGFPLGVEVWPQTGDSINEEDVINQTINELKKFGVIDEHFELQFAKVERVHGGGFPLPTLNNIANMNVIRSLIEKKQIYNLIPIGVLAEKNVFFIKDVMLDAFEKIKTK